MSVAWAGKTMQRIAIVAAAAVLILRVIQCVLASALVWKKPEPKTFQLMVVSYCGSRMTRVPVTYRSLSPVGMAQSLFVVTTPDFLLRRIIGSVC